jgi:hypothetical protein
MGNNRKFCLFFFEIKLMISFEEYLLLFAETLLGRDIDKNS